MERNMKRLPTVSIRLSRLLLTLVFVGMIGAPVLAQQPYYDWKIGGGVGTMAYYGDLSYRWNATRFSVPAYTIFLEKKVSPSFGIQLNGTYGQITGNDRTKNWKGDLLTANPDFGRSLNFKTDIRAASLLLQYHFDNGHLLSQYSTFSPYVFAGVGITDFTVYGDLFDGSGNRYYYWSDNTIRSTPESNGGEVPVINQDGKYETKLTGLNTEVNSYPTTVLSIPAGVGVKIRLTDQLSANVQAGATYAFTDYLDDVSGNYASAGYNNELQAYAANPADVIRQPRGEGKNNHDLYFSSFVTLSYHFGYKQKNFKAPLVYTGYKTVSAPVDNKTMARTKTTVPATIPNQKPLPVSGLNQPASALTNPQRMDSSQPQVADSKNYSKGSMPAYSSSSPEPSPASSITYRTNPVGRLNDVRAEEDSVRNETTLQQATQPAARSRTDAVPYSSSSIREPGHIRKGNIRNTVGYDYSGNPRSYDRYRSNYASDTDDANRRRLDNRYATEPRSTYYSRSPENTRTYVPIPLSTGGNNTDAKTMQANTDAVNQLRTELANLQAEMSRLRSQNDSLTNRKLDSLSTVVGALDRQATENLRARYGADTLGAKADSIAQSAAAASSDSLLVSSLHNQIEVLNQSLSQLRSKADNTPPVSPVVSRNTTYGSKTIYFGINKASLTPADKLHVADLIEKLKTDTALKLKVSGYTDRTGNAAHNLLLSKKRAENIVKYMAKEAGIDPGRIQITYYGQTEKASNKIKNNPYQRKVELELVTD